MSRAKGVRKDCDLRQARQRLIDARQFLEAAELLDAPDVVATNAIHAAIAAADVITCLALGERSGDGSHVAAVTLLRSVDASLATTLKRCLDRKTQAGYESTDLSRPQRRRRQLRALGASTPGGRRGADGVVTERQDAARSPMSGRSVTYLAFSSALTIDEVAQKLAGRLALTFERRDSDWRGGVYLIAGDWRNTYTEQVIVQRNEDLGRPAEDVEAPTLVYVETTERPLELIASITGIGLDLLRREDWQVP